MSAEQKLFSQPLSFFSIFQLEQRRYSQRFHFIEQYRKLWHKWKQELEFLIICSILFYSLCSCYYFVNNIFFFANFKVFFHIIEKRK